MNPQVIAAQDPDRLATIMAGSGESMTYRELDDKARRIASVFRSLGLEPGDHIAMIIDNEIMYHPVAWGAWFATLYWTPISTRLSAEETRYIIEDSGAKLVVASPAHENLVAALRPQLPQVAHWFLTAPGRGAIPDLEPCIAAVQPLATGPESPVGVDMLYSSGTTGRPKGIKPAFGVARDTPHPLTGLLGKLYGFDADTRYLTPAPLYHGAPTKYSSAIHRLGGTNVILEKFEAADALAAIERYGITHSQWVPTMLQRLERLPDNVKKRHDLSSHRVAIHAAAPCPPELKQRMIDWWGPIVMEYYAGSEAVGYTSISSQEWLERPGSVGRSVLGEVRILGDDGEELPPGEIGAIYFANGPRMEYHNDPAKTARAYNDRGWATLGDMGRVDEEGFLFLADRKDFMIISGGVNVYPAEIEQVITMHPEVEDVAVFGLPNPEFGEEVKAVIQPVDPAADQDDLRQRIAAFCQNRLSRIKQPRFIDFVAALPRQPNGKLYKGPLRASYLAAAKQPV